MKKANFKTEFKECIQCYFDKEYDLLHMYSNTPKISVYFMIGYLSSKLGKKVAKEIEEYMDTIMEERRTK